MAPLPPCDQRHLWLHYQVEGYTKEIVHDFEQRLETIFGRQVNRVHILDFEGLTSEMRQDLAVRLRMVYTGGDGQWCLQATLGGDYLGSEHLYISGSGHAPEKVTGRKSGAMLSRGHFIGCLAAHFGLFSDEGLRGLQVVARDGLWMPVDVLTSHLTAPSSTAQDFLTRGVSDLRLEMPTPLQPFILMTSPTLDLFPNFLL
nr:hypothetical protein [Tanacetum cinerariifolium]